MVLDSITRNQHQLLELLKTHHHVERLAPRHHKRKGQRLQALAQHRRLHQQQPGLSQQHAGLRRAGGRAGGEA
jgi:hypothetical protein